MQNDGLKNCRIECKVMGSPFIKEGRLKGLSK
jgi:hypothetical protein